MACRLGNPEKVHYYLLDFLNACPALVFLNFTLSTGIVFPLLVIYMCVFVFMYTSTKGNYTPNQLDVKIISHLDYHSFRIRLFFPNMTFNELQTYFPQFSRIWPCARLSNFYLMSLFQQLILEKTTNSLLFKDKQTLFVCNKYSIHILNIVLQQTLRIGY